MFNIDEVVVGFSAETKKFSIKGGGYINVDFCGNPDKIKKLYEALSNRSYPQVFKATEKLGHNCENFVLGGTKFSHSDWGVSSVNYQIHKPAEQKVVQKLPELLAA